MMIMKTQEFPVGRLTSFLVSQLATRAGAFLAIMIASLLLALSPQTANAQGKTILIFAPHPDDEALCCAGIISAAKTRGDTVKVVVVTNGDAFASPALGYTRESESVSAMSLLGLDESDIIFLGYGDWSLQDLYQSASPTNVLTSSAGQTQTYANRGLGHVDYHTFLYGVPGPYNRQTILGDYEAVIQNFQPDEIYTTGIADTHPDHSSTYSFLAEALIALQKEGLAKVPRVHEMIIHEPCFGCDPSYQWPKPVFTPSQPYIAPPYLGTNSQYLWNQIEAVPVPPSMQDPSATSNLKERVIAQYFTQVGTDASNWLFSFVK
jgi:LmbE family N-acetylglucosaminyl deacetylase